MRGKAVLRTTVDALLSPVNALIFFTAGAILSGVCFAASKDAAYAFGMVGSVFGCYAAALHLWDALVFYRKWGHSVEFRIWEEEREKRFSRMHK